MKGTDEKRAAAPRRMRSTEIALPWGRFYWRDWMSDPRIRRLSFDQRGRFMDVWAATHGTRTPGLMTEDDVRAWAGYDPKDWRLHRDVFAQVFAIGKDGKWRLVDVIREFKASIEAAKTRRRVAMAGVQKRREVKELGTAGATTGAQQSLEVGPAVQPEVGHRCSDGQKSRSSDPQTSAVPDPQPSARSGQSSRPSAGGTSGTPGVVSVGEVLARALGDAAVRPAATNPGSGKGTP